MLGHHLPNEERGDDLEKTEADVTMALEQKSRRPSTRQIAGVNRDLVVHMASESSN